MISKQMLGVKVNGVYDTKADVRAKALKDKINIIVYL